MSCVQYFECSADTFGAAAVLKHMVIYHRRSSQRNVYTMQILQVDICTDRDIHYYTHTLSRTDHNGTVPLKMPNQHLPSVLWNISFPFRLKTFWHLGALFSKKSSCEDLPPLMTMQSANVSAWFCHSWYCSRLQWGNSQNAVWLWITLLLNIFCHTSIVSAEGANAAVKLLKIFGKSFTGNQVKWKEW